MSSSYFSISAAIVILGVLVCPLVNAAEPKASILSRVFYQDSENATLYWADVSATDAPALSKPAVVDGFPELDPAKQSLVQMRIASGMLLVGVRDEEDGEFQSGWVLVDTGVREEEHGDHSHWHYEKPPVVRAMKLDDAQGNPAHLYCYDGVFYLANDAKNGFTRLDPSQIKDTDSGESIVARAAFHSGGGGHITLAVDDGYAVSTWAGRDGENAGRVDVTPVSSKGTEEIAISFPLGFSGLHGATSAAGKFFFAPSDGVCWVSAKDAQKMDPSSIQVHHIDLGKDGETSRRTGSFTTHGDNVLFLTGKGETASLAIIDASEDQPEVLMISVPTEEGARLAGPIVATPLRQSPLAFLFHDHAPGVDSPDIATVVQLDPDKNGKFNDAKITTEIALGKSAVVGHAGHHEMGFDARGRFAWVSNPGDKNLTVLNLENLTVVATHELVGTPSHLVSIGGRGH